MDCANNSTSNTDTELYTHKKFGNCFSRRIRQDSMEAKGETQQSSSTKHLPLSNLSNCRTNIIFRPWILQDKKAKKKKNANNKRLQIRNSIHYYSNKVRSYPPKERSPKEQMRRDRNTQACLRSRRTKRAEELQVEDEYATYKQHQTAAWDEIVRATLYLKALERLERESGLRTSQPCQP